MLSALDWYEASTPKYFPNLNGESDNLSYNYKRGKLAWYSIDPIFYTNSRPQGINNNDISNNKTRRIFINEIFPEQDLVQGSTTVQQTFDLAFYPNEKGPYNNSNNINFQSNLSENCAVPWWSDGCVPLMSQGSSAWTLFQNQNDGQSAPDAPRPSGIFLRMF